MNKPLTPKQAERLQAQIAGVKRRLAAEKRRFGAYDDSGGYRYLPPKLYVRLGDYAGGLRYTRWFDKNFGDDIGYPDFLFEWTILLFKNGRLKDAERKAAQTFCCNTYLFDRFFGRPLVPRGMWEGSNLEMPYLAELLPYSSQDPELADFADWLRHFESTAKFMAFAARFVSIGQQLKGADDYETRRALLDERRALEAGL
ncbi:hypothetical protein [Hymenobacter sp. IS2118]|uniref:hypothetical protein n=1 Tax=Hymenobacter sp. IS2118 TaxID=1505605 RepID=UPI0005510EFE|nr:hypothetical protein [Hymenobacter sp. IS2118]